MTSNVGQIEKRTQARIVALFREVEKAAGDTSKHLYNRNQDVYSPLRYGVKVSPGGWTSCPL